MNADQVLDARELPAPLRRLREKRPARGRGEEKNTLVVAGAQEEATKKRASPQVRRAYGSAYGCALSREAEREARAGQLKQPGGPAR